MFIFFANSWRPHIWWLSFKREDCTPIKYVHASEIAVHHISTNLTLEDVLLSLMHLFICWGLFESVHVLNITFRELHFENSLISWQNSTIMKISLIWYLPLPVHFARSFDICSSFMRAIFIYEIVHPLCVYWYRTVIILCLQIVL